MTGVSTAAMPAPVVEVTDTTGSARGVRVLLPRSLDRPYLRFVAKEQPY